jgi:inorganic phosphate transporter, PiT family
MLALTFVIVTALLVSYANGANDNFKGVATLYGSNTVGYKNAIALATVSTFAGSIASVFLAAVLVKLFSGKGVVPDEVAESSAFVTAVAAGAAGTVMLATVLGFPISTTHSLTGAIVGAGAMAVGAEVNLKVLASSFFLPLLLAPLLAIALTVPLYRSLKWVKGRLLPAGGTCVCVGAAQLVPNRAAWSPVGLQLTFAQASIAEPAILMSDSRDCLLRNHGQLLIVPIKSFIDYAHYASAGAVSFARGLNDTPKIVGLLLVVQALDIRVGTLSIAFAMALGGLLSARKVAHTMSKNICRMDDGPALAANIVTAALVISASPLGLPVSTTHVSVGAIGGAGIVNGTADKRIISGIVLSWIITLPVAACLGGLTYVVVASF